MPYALDGHRHLPEMTQELGGLAEAPSPQITFVPHYIPMPRGILSTCYARLRPGQLVGGSVELRAIYNDFYASAPFVRVVDAPPSTKHVLGTNWTLIHTTVSPQTGTLIITSAIDNLGKGAAGGGVQCLNVMFGMPETAGLEQVGLYP
jgi:N-acetyl-gamma-glutamyl-phosphate reductase